MAVLGMPVGMLPCAALTSVIGVWALLVAAVVLVLLGGVAAWSTGRQR